MSSGGDHFKNLNGKIKNYSVAILGINFRNAIHTLEVNVRGKMKYFRSKKKDNAPVNKNIVL